MTDKFTKQAIEEAAAEPGARIDRPKRADGRIETRLMRADGDDLLIYDFVNKGWERLPGMRNTCFFLEDRWRKIEEPN